ncbi:hypothetical protein MY149_05345 [Acinetobacter indicus]|nr:hypothetical protein [Acinetobacter indicus]
MLTLDSEKSIADLAKLFGKTEGQILRDRATLRKILKIKKLKDIHQAWLLANQEVLQDSSLKKEEIAQKLGIEPKQVYRKKDNSGNYSTNLTIMI